MNPHIKKAFRQAVRTSDVRPTRVLEVGGKTDDRSILRFPELVGAELTCLNVEEQPARRGAPPDEPIPLVIGNANHMEMFEDDAFDIVVSNAMLEHDPCFWSSVAEMRRVLRPGGLLFIGVPGFVPLTFDDGTSTRTYRFHGGQDFWRFSDMAVRTQFFADFDDVHVEAILDPPRIVGHGRKPGVSARVTSR